MTHGALPCCTRLHGMLAPPHPPPGPPSGPGEGEGGGEGEADPTLTTEFSTASMEGTAFEQLWLRLGSAAVNLYCHQVLTSSWLL